MQSELLQMRQFMRKYAPNESMLQNINDTSSGQMSSILMNKYHKQLGYLVLLKLHQLLMTSVQGLPHQTSSILIVFDNKL
ncbi:hypothetical protein H5410_014460 [Solanum commersonii]|uniref:Uncharacterized protein n=1 Tax=Solanum commersonii TaxID=4109 RepID=A0A9J5ZRG9_SOLCO|nr:hypothetical protein H5410_014460 [Solanum commersonii]